MEPAVNLFNTNNDANFKAALSQELYFIRGVAIVLVVIGHVIGNSKASGMRQMHDSDIFGLTWLSDFIYTFHMPIFFIASGIAFATFSSKNITWIKFVQFRLRRLLIPLVCWAPVFFIFQSLSKGDQVTIFNITNAVIHPYAIFWFIHALTFASCFSFVCLKIFKSKLIYMLLSIIIFALSLFSENSMIYWIIDWNIFYACGFFLAFYLDKIYSIIETSSLKLIYTNLALLLMIMFITNYFLTVNQMTNFINGIIAFLFIYTIGILVKVKQLSIPFGKILHSIKCNFIYWGKISITIYLFHIYFINCTRILLSKFFNTTNPSLHLILGFSTGMIGSIIIYNFLYNKSKIFRYSIGELK